jgi:hypothetical protein
MPKNKQQTQTVSGVAIRQRGCGWPIAGGTYLYVKTGFGGHPIWDFVIDPTVPVTEDFISMSAIGMILKERPGMVDKNGNPIYDLYDWIGGSGYPNPLDWLLEVQQMGFHQKVNSAQMQWLSEESLYFAVHARAGLVNLDLAYQTHVVHPDYPQCPGGHEAHIDAQNNGGSGLDNLGTCVGLLFDDVIKGTKPKDNRVTIREMPSFSWDGFVPVEKDLEHQPSIFFRLPIGRMAQFLVYEDKENNTHEDALKELDNLDAKLKRIKIVPMS